MVGLVSVITDSQTSINIIRTIIDSSIIYIHSFNLDLTFLDADKFITGFYKH